MKINIESVKVSYSTPDIVKSYLDKQEKVGVSLPELKLINKYSNNDDRIIDIGCGTGRVSIALERNNYSNILGVDISDEMLLIAKMQISESSRVRFEKLNIVQEYPNDEEFDLALGFHGITPIPGRDNRLKALRNIKRILRNNGIMILSTFLRSDDQAFWISERDKWSKGAYDQRLIEYGDILIKKNEAEIFIHIPSKSSFEELINEADFDLLECVEWDELIEEDEMKDIHKAQKCTYWVIKSR